jgi:hypothetical protein
VTDQPCIGFWQAIPSKTSLNCPRSLAQFSLLQPDPAAFHLRCRTPFEALTDYQTAAAAA